MKKILQILLFITLPLFLCGQTLLDTRITATLDNLSLSESIQLIQEKSGVSFAYTPDILPADVRITFSGINTTLSHFLNVILSDTGFGFELVGKQVVIFKKSEPASTRKYTISGFVQDAATGERLISASVYDQGSNLGVYTNNYGFFSLTLPAGVINLSVSYLGYQPDLRMMNLDQNITLSIPLASSLTLNEVLITAQRTKIDQLAFPNRESILEAAKRLPQLGGEPDILQAASKLTGIQTGADGVGGLNIRGGSSDQNLILLDDTPIYNPTHTWGVFSVFNTSAIQSFDLYKSGFPARYGGRLSSVFDIRTKDGNNQEFDGELDLGLVASKATFEGPIEKGKASFFVSGRRSLTDFISVPYYNLSRRKEGINGSIRYFFYDLNLKINYAPTLKDRLYFSIYNGGDIYRDNKSIKGYATDTLAYYDEILDQDWGNTVAAFRWNRTLSAKLFSNTTLTFSRFFYQSKNIVNVEAFKKGVKFLDLISLGQYNSNIEDNTAKIDFDYYHSPTNTLRFGLQASYFIFQPGVISVSQDVQANDNLRDSIIVTLDTFWRKSDLRSQSLSFYAEDQFDFLKNGKASLGIHAALFQSGNKTYFSWQPRIRIGWNFPKDWSAGAHGEVNTQFLHLLSATTIGLPNDIWVGSTDRVKPQESLQITLWLLKKFKEDYEIKWNGYYKSLHNLIAFQESATFLLNASNWENEIVAGIGKSYGMEFEIRKSKPRYAVWANYTLAYADRKFEGLNFDEKYPFRYDRRHVVNMAGIWKVSAGIELSGSWVYATGLATSLPVGRYAALPGVSLPPIEVFTFESPNAFRLPAYHHFDIGANFRWYSQSGKERILRCGIYNMYFRRNPIYYELRESAQYFQRYVPPFLPSLSYNIKI